MLYQFHYVCIKIGNKISKILIYGATGKVGEAVTRFFLNETDDTELVLYSESFNKIAPDLRCKVVQINYKDSKWVKKSVLDERPDCVVNAAAMTNVDACEDDKNLAMELNAHLPEVLAKACKLVGAHLISFSTDYIFDGAKGPYTEEATPDPKSYYGKSKLAGENAIRKELKEHTIFRTNVVYGRSAYGKSDFMQWVVSKLEAGDDLNIITGQYCNPTFVDDLGWMTVKAFEKKSFGTYHISGSDYLNRYEIAQLAAEIFDNDKNKIHPIDPSELKQKAERPERGGLVTLKAEAELGYQPTSLKSGLLTLKFQLSEHTL